ncbi:MAG TPA: hypothetical protein VN033_02815 [Vulgatibacter sp.]|nr:hypothetical protein [Vulgatibacter sp.]
MRAIPLCAIVVCIGSSWLLGCGGEERGAGAAGLGVEVPRSLVSMSSTRGCMLDVDCAEGLFCFQNQCTWECRDDGDCREGARCSTSGRCLADRGIRALTDGTVEVTLDEEALADVPGQVPVAIAEQPPTAVEIDPGQPFVTVSMQTVAPVPGGAVMYRVELEGEEDKTPRTLRSEGETEFRFQIPTGRAAGNDGEAKLQRAFVVTSLGGFRIDIIPRIALGGLYAADVNVREFGGSALPMRFGLRIEPENASLEEATGRWVLLPASAQDLLSPTRGPGTDGLNARWVERPLEYDAEARVWFARFSHPFEIGGASQFGSGESTRSIRLEIHEVEGKRIVGALADRWEGLFDARTADGVIAPAQVVLSGPFTAFRQQRLPPEALEPIPGQASAPKPALGMPLEIDACGPDVFEPLLDEVSIEPEKPCEGITGLDGFRNASPLARATCALAVADRALQGPSTASQVRAFLDDSQPNPGGISFGEFLQRCAEGDGFCVPSPALACSEQLLAFAYQTQEDELPVAGDLLERYQLAARESYLGRQLAAFQVDTDIRLDWLRKSEAPLFLAADLRAYNEDMLSKWEKQVLQAHFDVLARQFAPSSLEVLARAPTDREAIAIRKTILLEQAQTWQGAMEALQIAAQRWNGLYQNDLKREQAANYVRARTLDLYLSAAVLSHLNRSSGTSATSSIFGSGFAALLRTQEQLALPFDDLIFMRDAEVVVSQSVDPQSSSQTVLRELEDLARRAVADAQESVDRVIDDAQAAEVNSKVLTDRMRTQAEELKAELVALCGLPLGCTVADMDERPECTVAVEPGRCGFLTDPESGTYQSFEDLEGMENVSEAGQAILALRQALLESQMAENEFRDNEERARIELENAQAFADKLAEWRDRRRAVEVEIDQISAEIDAIGSATLRAQLAEINAARKLRHDAYEKQAEEIEKWSTIRYEGIEDDMKRMTAINALNQTAGGLTLVGDEVDRIAEAVADGMPKAIGMSNDVSAPFRLAVKLSTYGLTSVLRVAAFAMETTAVALEQKLTEEQARREAKLANLSDLAELQAMQTERDLEDLAGELRAIELLNDDAIAAREALIDALRRNLEYDLAYERDLVELKDRRLQAKIRLQDSEAAKVRILRSEIVVQQRFMAYMQVVQRGQLLLGRYTSLNERLGQLENLIASPSVIFAFANRLARAESRVERAKGLLFDWLVGLEYYAVRPFVSQRLAILLARNPSQLEAISNELLRLQRVCGGMITYEVVDLSVRDDLLHGGFDMMTESGEVDAAARFRAVLEKGNVPVDTQVRYSTDERIGDVIANRSVLAATFDLRLDDFANLPLTCNAKIASIDVQLVGEGLGQNVRPTVSILYDGKSTMRSCQPNIQAIVGALGPGTTAFGPRTTFRTAGRSVSPVARIGSFGEPGTANRGLEGLPLASQYTILIDPAKGENRNVDWGRLEDVMLRLTYVYQDMFPDGQCE